MVFDFFAVVIDPVFNPLLMLNPALALFLFSGILTTVIYSLNKLMVNKKLLKEIKENLTNTREKLSKAQKEGNKDEINKLLNEMMTINNHYMRQTFKMLIVSTIVLIILFPWASHRFGDTIVVSHPFISLLGLIPLINAIPNWLVWYILSSISVSWLLRKFIGE